MNKRQAVFKKLFYTVNFKLSVVGLISSLLLSCAGGGPTLEDLTKTAGSVLGQAGPLSSSDIARGLKEALSKGSTAVVSQLGKRNGFAADSNIHIPLPNSLQKARDAASKVGLEGSFDDLEERLNRAAEQATPKAKALFLGAIQKMSIDDAKNILQGPDNAATQYFRDKTGVSLKQSMRPLIDKALSEVGAVTAFNTLLDRYNQIPFAPRIDADLTGHVVDKGSDGIFYYLAEEEKAIRTDPLKRSTELLQRVFGAQ